MKRWGVFIVLSVLLILSLLVSPVLAKDPELPEKGALLAAIASLQQQIDELQAQVDAINSNSAMDGIDWSELYNRPEGLDDGDDNTQLTEEQVDAYVANNGYATSAQVTKLGTLQEKQPFMSYLAETDGFVVAHNVYKGPTIDGSVMMTVYTGNVPFPTEHWVASSNAPAPTPGQCAQYASITMPIKQGDYWYLVTSLGDDYEPKIYWIPFGN